MRKIILRINVFFFKKTKTFICSVVLVSGIQQSESVIPIHSPLFFRFFSHKGHYRVLSRVPCAISRSLLVGVFLIP